MFVAASTDCFRKLPFKEALQKLVDLEYTAVDVPLNENNTYLKPSKIEADLEAAIDVCMSTLRLDVIAYDTNITAEGEAFYRQFAACCKLAKATKVVPITVPSAELGTPFNQEVEHLRTLVAIASLEGVQVSIKSQVGRLSEDPDTVKVLCDNVEGLGLTLDPSHYVCGPNAGKNYDRLMKYVHHVHLRDTSKEKFQVRIGQGEIDYGRLISQLAKVNYKRALTAHIDELEGVDHMGEMRKMRLLLESSL